jgi:hypothetical protein
MVSIFPASSAASTDGSNAPNASPSADPTYEEGKREDWENCFAARGVSVSGSEAKTSGRGQCKTSCNGHQAT